MTSDQQHLNQPRHRRILTVWAVLVISTVVSWAESHQPSLVPAAFIILGLTALKVILVAHSYMEIAHAPIWLKASVGGWVGVVFTALGILVLAPNWATSLT